MTTEETTKFKKSLKRICELSDVGFCPGCGLTPKGIEHIEQEARSTLLNELIEEVEKMMGKGTAFHEDWMSGDGALNVILNLLKSKLNK